MLTWFRNLFNRADQHDADALSPQSNSADTASGVSVSISTLLEQGVTCLQAGDAATAKTLFNRALDSHPDDADALYLSGLSSSHLGEFDIAMSRITRAITIDDKNAAFHAALGNLYIAQNRISEALTPFDLALKLEPDNVQTLSDSAFALHASGDAAAALLRLQHALKLNPEANAIRYNIATLKQAQGKLDEAIIDYQELVRRDAHHADAWNNLGSAQLALGHFAKAIDSFRHALALAPESSNVQSNLGCALQANRQSDAAEDHLLRAIVLNPKELDAYTNLALVHREQGRLDASLTSSARSLCLVDSTAERVRMATLLPVIASSADEIATWRRHFAQSTQAMLNVDGMIEDPLRNVGTCNFNLAYQPESDRDLQQGAAQMYLQLAPSLNYVAPHCLHKRVPQQRIKVGFISKFMHAHSIGRTTRGLLANLSQDDFEVIALFVPPFVDDDLSRFICEHASRHIMLPPTLESAREQIAALELDILFYQDIGMDAYTYYLAFSRLAPVQCLTFGHPDTTGIPNMDYWVSSEGFEQDGAEAHYSEKLFLLKGIGTLAYYYRPTLQATQRTRSHFGLPEQATLYACPQSLFKLHPDFDAIIANILHGDPQGHVVLVEARNKSWGRILRERLQRAMPDVFERIVFAPPMSSDDFLSLVALADVILDTIYFNGMNTSLEGFAMGVPIVTMPSQLQRGRHTYGMYRHMGIDDCIANSPQQYVEIALRLGKDIDFRRAVREKIRARNGALFEDINVVREFERFFREAHAQANALI